MSRTSWGKRGGVTNKNQARAGVLCLVWSWAHVFYLHVNEGREVIYPSTALSLSLSLCQTDIDLFAKQGDPPGCAALPKSLLSLSFVPGKSLDPTGCCHVARGIHFSCIELHGCACAHVSECVCVCVACAFIDLNLRADSSQAVLGSVCVCVCLCSDTGSSCVLEQVRVHLAPSSQSDYRDMKGSRGCSKVDREDLIYDVTLLHQEGKYPG